MPDRRLCDTCGELFFVDRVTFHGHTCEFCTERLVSPRETDMRNPFA